MKIEQVQFQSCLSSLFLEASAAFEFHPAARETDIVHEEFLVLLLLIAVEL